MSEDRKQMVVGDYIVNIEHMKSISKEIGPVIADVIDETGGVTEKALPGLVAKKLPDTDMDDIKICVAYACSIMTNNVLVLEELQQGEMK